MRPRQAAREDRLIVLTVAGALALSASFLAEAQSYTVLKQFPGGGADGENPYGSLIVAGSTMYGMTTFGDFSGGGIIFKVNTDGSGFSTLHTFVGGANDGATPYGTLTMYGSTLYGVTFAGGASGNGSAFRMNIDGSGFSVIHSFSGGGDDGIQPFGALTMTGSTLYGTASRGGASDNGVLFRMNPDGSDYNVIHQFVGGSPDGRRPFGSLTLVGSTLFGMASRGGSSDFGAVFQINTDGSGFGLLHQFTGGTNDGQRPLGSLALSGSTLYGMTLKGGDTDSGVLFKLSTNGSEYGLLHKFIGGGNDGTFPNGSLSISGSTMYGMTMDGGDSNLGVIFQMHTDGSGFSLLHEFGGTASDGTEPWGDLSVVGSALYGMTPTGGDSGLGTIFSYQIPEPGSGMVLIVGCLLVGWRSCQRFWSQAGSSQLAA